ncbi:Hypothetical protein NGAL_HAMBI2605_62660 [Neorhizobium galegae bv. orientalis]|nr:Hypothetical protein NGAL_HAMBI2605_62660 [Neorhizobium galegae bv. orientalis]
MTEKSKLTPNNMATEERELQSDDSGPLSRRNVSFEGEGIAGALVLPEPASAVTNSGRDGITPPVPNHLPQSLVADTSTFQEVDIREKGPGANPAAPQSFSVKPGPGENVVTPYPFNGKHLTGVLVSNLYHLDTKPIFPDGEISSIIFTNLGSQAVFVSAGEQEDASPAEVSPLKHTVQPLQSAIIQSGALISTANASADGLVSLIQVSQPKNQASDVFADSDTWAQYHYPRGFPPLPLWISSQIHLDHRIEIDPWRMAGQPSPAGSKPLDYTIYANIWWLPAGSDAGVHDAHHRNFLEIHTQLVGFGRMQKFKELKTAQEAVNIDPANVALSDYAFPFDASASFSGLYEEHRLAPGATHAPMPLVTSYDAWGEHSDIARAASAEDPCFYYPPHQYYADTDCIWIAFEFHRAL